MKTRLVKIGKSRGVRIPELLLEQAGLEEEVEITPRCNALVIRSSKKPRAGWAKAFAQMARHGDDALLDEGINDP
jgi:antitoxin MazE